MRRNSSDDAERLWRVLQDDPTDVLAWRELRVLLDRRGRSIGELFVDAYASATIPTSTPRTKSDEDRIFSAMLRNAMWIVESLDAFGWSFLLVCFPHSPGRAFIAAALDTETRAVKAAAGRGRLGIPIDFRFKLDPHGAEDRLCIRGAHKAPPRPAEAIPQSLEQAAALIVKDRLCPICLEEITDPDAPLLLSLLERSELRKQRENAARRKYRDSLSDEQKQNQHKQRARDRRKKFRENRDHRERYLDQKHREDNNP